MATNVKMVFDAELNKVCYEFNVRLSVFKELTFS